MLLSGVTILLILLRDVTDFTVVVGPAQYAILVLIVCIRNVQEVDIVQMLLEEGQINVPLMMIVVIRYVLVHSADVFPVKAQTNVKITTIADIRSVTERNVNGGNLQGQTNAYHIPIAISADVQIVVPVQAHGVHGYLDRVKTNVIRMKIAAI